MLVDNGRGLTYIAHALSNKRKEINMENCWETLKIIKLQHNILNDIRVNVQKLIVYVGNQQPSPKGKVHRLSCKRVEFKRIRSTIPLIRG